MVHQRFAAAHRMQHVDFEVAPPVLLAVHAAAATHAGHEDVAPAERGGGTSKPAGVGFGIADIERFSDGLYPARGQSAERLLHLVLGSCAQTDVDAFAGQEIDDGAPDPLGGAGDDCLFSLKTKVHRCPPGRVRRSEPQL